MPLFSRARSIIAMIHVHASPGAPGSREAPGVIASRAGEEARILLDAGFDGIIVENMHDRPYVHGAQGPEVVATMTRAALAVQDAIARQGRAVPLGVQVLSGGNREALAIALACGGSFVRVENFVFAHVADEGLLERAEAGPLLRYRRAIGAESIAVLCDVKKKHASHAITADVPIADAAEAAEFFGADGLIVTGTATGKPTSVDDVRAVRRATTLPVLVGSGVTPASVPDLFHHADALIVGSWIKADGLWSNAPDPARCRAIVEAPRG